MVRFMKRYSFEKMNGIVIISTIFLLIEGIFLFVIFHKKIELFSRISGVVVDQEVVLYLNEIERKNLYANTYFYIDNKKIIYHIKEDRGIVLYQDSIPYYGIVLDFQFSKKFKTNDMIEMSIQMKNIRLIDYFKIVFGGD